MISGLFRCGLRCVFIVGLKIQNVFSRMRSEGFLFYFGGLAVETFYINFIVYSKKYFFLVFISFKIPSHPKFSLIFPMEFLQCGTPKRDACWFMLTPWILEFFPEFFPCHNSEIAVLTKVAIIKSVLL